MDGKKDRKAGRELKPSDREALAAFKEEMTDKVIPEILKTVEKRRVMAAHTRRQQLKI